MTSWNDVLTEAPDVAGLAQARIEATGLALLATLRSDGSPRISGVEPLFAGGELWLGMMPDSRKGLDLRRDPRLALHNATVDKHVTEGDAKISGRAVETSDPHDVAFMRQAFAAATGAPPPEGPMQLFRVDVTEVSTVRPAGDHLDLAWWQVGKGVTRRERH